MNRQPLDIYDKYPEAMIIYLKHYGYHFNRKAYEFAVSLMESRDGSEIKPMPKEDFENELKRLGVKLENDTLYDGAYVYAMAKSDYFKSSITTEQSLALFVKDTIDDVDAPDGAIFVKWYACMTRAGQPIDWEDLL